MLHVGQIIGDYRFEPNQLDSPYPHRKQVNWMSQIYRDKLTPSTINTLGSLLTVFQVKQAQEVLGEAQIISVTPPQRELSIEKTILAHILELDDKELEELVAEILNAIGFEAQAVGGTGDEGIDVQATIDGYGFTSIDLVVQVKRYDERPIDHNAIKKFRGEIPKGSQAAFVTTSIFNEKAYNEAAKLGFERINLINGMQLM